MWKFEIYKDIEDEFRFNLKTENSIIIITSKGYKSKLSCTKGIQTFKNISYDDSRYEWLESETGNPYFNVKTYHGSVIVTSEMFFSFVEMQDRITEIMKYTTLATVENKG